MLQNIKNIYGKKIAAAGLVVGSMAVSGSAFATAADPTAGAFTALTAKITSLEAQTWPVVVAVFVAMAGITLFKKFAGKAL
ncbi:hypothetical protein CTM76_19185 [Photobacterium phosphoreum]|uniref:major coat protein n=1 Tax=Photobacterium phosphoreum TaxID=659 RepID=UPI0007F8B909|nr:major coat protein [Photobacterium phosphoreum]OBU37506.1 hypothetical protein AYY25_17540 [Photobacterium phosphoreum]PSU75447.1 hypothetical protein CTM76_19185 [Photobacterium phosphoreum]